MNKTPLITRYLPVMTEHDYELYAWFGRQASARRAWIGYAENDFSADPF